MLIGRGNPIRSFGRVIRMERERAHRAQVRQIRARVRAGSLRRHVAIEVGVSYSFVRSVTADMKVARRRDSWPRVYTDDDLAHAVAVSDAHSSYAYVNWRASETERGPSILTITKRFGSWTAAVDAARRLELPQSVEPPHLGQTRADSRDSISS